MKNRLASLSGGMCFALALSASLLAQDAWNPGSTTRAPNQEQGMHACPTGTAIAAVRAIGDPKNFNDFLCRKLTTQNSAVKTVVSRAQRQIAKSHTCPKGYYLRGMNIEQNRFLCSTHPGANVSENDGDIQIVTSGMSCGTGQVLVGYNDNERKVLCLSVDGI